MIWSNKVQFPRDRFTFPEINMRWTALVSLILPLTAIPAQASAQGGRVAGKVTESATQRPIAGVEITLMGPDTIRAVTGESGDYAVPNAAAGAYTMRTSMLGFAASEQRVSVAAGATVTVNFVLEPSAISLEGIVAIGYGSVQRREVTGAVASISSGELTKVPTANVTESMQGKLPGVDITRSSGSPNSGASLLVRGERSLTASNSPLVIIDGVQFGNLSQLNPNDIESVQVLKDAASTAIYGSRGANGVLLVTTKQGSGGRTSFSVNSYVGATEITDYPAINTAEQYVTLKREAYRTSGLWTGPQDDPKIFSQTELDNIASGVATDFRDLIFRDGLSQSHQASVTTGSERTQGYLSLGVYDETGILRSDELRRYSLRVNVDHSLSDYWKVGTHSQLTYFDRDRRRNPLNLANKIDPLTAAYDANGDLIVFPNNGKDISPLADEQPNAFADNELETYMVPSLFAQFGRGGVTFRSTLGASLSNRRRGTFAAPNTIDQAGAASAATYQAYNARNYSWENVLTYRADIGEHSLSLTGVGSYFAYKNDESSVLGRNQLLPSQLFYNLGAATQGIAVSSGYEESSLLSGAGRLNYDWKDRYLVTLTGRFDGSSRLSEGNKWAFFPAVALAWRISEESFLSDVSFLDELKLRVSYGVSGNDAVAPYSTQASLQSIPFSFDENFAPGYTFSSQVGNSNLKWELSHTTNFGADAILWNNRVSANLDIYKTRTTDLLLERFLPLTSGVSSVIQNIGATENRGIELGITTQNLERDNTSWTTNLTFFRNREKITELVGGTDDVANGWFIGYPADVYFDYEKIGIWQLGEEAEAAKFNQAPGDIRVKDQNGDGQITADDRVVLGSPRPDWSGALTNNVSWRSLDFTATLFARMGQLMRYEFYDTYKPDGVENGAAVDYWTPDNPSNDFPRPNSRFPKNNYLYYSSLIYEDASFLKLRDATIGFTLPETLAQRVSAGRARIYLSGRNLLRWAKVDNYDPERGGSISDPMTRVFVTGIDITF